MENSKLINNQTLIQKKISFTAIAYTRYLKGLKRTHMMFRQGKLLESLAVKSWEIAPGDNTIVPKAYFFEEQINRITNTVFLPDPISLMRGGYSINQEPTRAYLLKNVFMINGSIYKGLDRLLYHHISRLNNKMNYLPPFIINTEINDASIYSSYDGNEYFYDWLVDDCPMYHLAASEGTPVTTDIFASPHMLDYESLLGMNPIRSNAAYLKNTVFFDDNWGNNKSKHDRFSTNRNKLLSQFPGTSHPGVFILRRNSGNARVMLNEIEIAEQLRDKYGFRIADVTKQTVAEIISECVGAQILIGIEGSQLTHGLMVLESGASVLTLQPPDRFSGVIKMTADAENLNFGFVVGIQKNDGFYINFEEIERTLELFPKKNIEIM